MTVTEEIKSRLDIVDIIGEHVQLRKSGRSFSGFCPFHSNTRTPAFHVFPESQTWHCFGACAEGGDVFNFVMKREGLDFREALEVLAQRAGVQLENRKDARKEAQDVRLLGLLNSAADYFHQLFLHAPQAEEARRYIAGRAFSEETVAEFRLGFALNAWDAARNHFGAQGYSQEELLAAGLLTQNEEKGTVYDRFRNRLMIPIRDLNGSVVGFGARTLEKDGIPKYLNSPQTVLFDKGRLLFGLYAAKRDIREARQVVIVEGYMDVMRAWQTGFRNVVAQMGTALTSDQLQLLKRYTKRFVMALDADAAGVNATLRSLTVARETLDRETDFSFDARGLVRQEGRLQADIRVIVMPEGQDPDDVLRQDAAAWPQLLETAQPIVAFVIDVVTRDVDPADPKAKNEAARQILPLIADIAEPVERDHYRQELARRLEISERSLREMWGQDETRGRRTVRGAQGARTVRQRPGLAPALPAGGRGVSTQLREANYLRECLRNPTTLSQVDLRLRDTNEPVVGTDDFSATEDKVLLSYLRQQFERGTIGTLEAFHAGLDETLQERVQFILNQESLPPDELHYLPDRLAKAVLDCRLERLKTMRHHVNELIQDASQQQDRNRLHAYMQQQVAIASRERQINRAKHLLSAVSQRES